MRVNTNVSQRAQQQLVLENFGAYGVRLTGRIHSVTFEESAGNGNDV